MLALFLLFGDQIKCGILCAELRINSIILLSYALSLIFYPVTLAISDESNIWLLHSRGYIVVIRFCCDNVSIFLVARFMWNDRAYSARNSNPRKRPWNT